MGCRGPAQEEASSARERERPRLGSREAGSGQAARQAARRRSRVGTRTRDSAESAERGGRPDRADDAGGSRWYSQYRGRLASTGTRAVARRRDVGLALLAHLRSQAALLRSRCDPARRGRRLECPCVSAAPADWNDVIGRFPRSGADDLDRAIASAKRGFAQWSKTPAPIRGQVLLRVGQLLVERKDAIARAMTREMGKVLAETRGDVQEGIDTAFYASTEGRRLFGRVVPSELRNKWAMSYRRPIGIAGLITPF